MKWAGSCSLEGRPGNSQRTRRRAWLVQKMRPGSLGGAQSPKLGLEPAAWWLRSPWEVLARAESRGSTSGPRGPGIYFSARWLWLMDTNANPAFCIFKPCPQWELKRDVSFWSWSSPSLCPAVCSTLGRRDERSSVLVPSLPETACPELLITSSPAFWTPLLSHVETLPCIVPWWVRP